MEHPDAQADADMMKPLVNAVEYLLDKAEQQDERIAKLEKLVVEELLGGIEKLYSENQRVEGIEAMKAKYGELFEPHMETYGMMYPGSDIYENLYKFLSESKAKEGFDEAQFEEGVKGIATRLSEMIAKLKGVAPEAEVKIEAEAKPEIEAGNDDLDKRIIERLKKSPSMKGL